MGFALSDMTLTSSAFEDGGPIPTRHTGEGEDVSPAFSWTEAPEGTRSFALICHDPDAPLVSPGTYGFVHWVLYGIPGSATELPEGTGQLPCRHLRRRRQQALHGALRPLAEEGDAGQ